MIYFIVVALTTAVLITQAQTSAGLREKSDSIRLLQQTVKLYDLDFTDAEADSMLNNVNSNLQLYKGMHRVLPTNDMPYPFAFNPAPAGTKVPDQKIKINWEIPDKIQLPANRNDLAFYSIPTLASLIKHKKITSVELTQFFIARLKKWE